MPSVLIPVYKAERDAGLAEKVSGSRISYASAVAVAGQIDPLVLSKLKAGIARGSRTDFDLHCLETVLVTTGWNLNDDVFDRDETWFARHTPEDKPQNLDHDCAQIVGHMTSNRVVDADGNLVADDSVVDELPDKFHIVAGVVVYKHWDKPELQEKVDSLLDTIARGEIAVSMECLFKGFDYALKGPDGSTKVVARNDQTAFLTKHLRAYGGTGRYNEYRVGRLMRNIVFSGNGFVKNPANPESVILTSGEPFVAAKAEFLRSCAELGYVPPANATRTRERVMNEDTLKAELAAAKAENEKLKTELADVAKADLKAKLDEAVKAKAAADELLAKAQESLKAAAGELDAAKKSAEALKADLDKAVEAKAAAEAELAKVAQEKLAAERVALVKDKLKFDDAAAAEFVEVNKALAAEAFDKQVELLAKAMTAWVSTNPQSGNTNFSGQTAQTPPKSTDKASPPKATDKPTGTKADKSEDAAGAAAADGADLDGAEPGKADAALATVQPNSGVTDMQKQIAAYLGRPLAEDK